MGAHFRCCRSDKREASEILARSGHCNRGGCCKDHCENEKVQHFVTEYAKQYEKRYLTQFAAAAYDCVYAIYDAMKSYEAGGTEIALDISPSALCDILKGVFQSDSFKFSGVTGTEITWHEDGTVNKAPDKYIVKEADPAA